MDLLGKTNLRMMDNRRQLQGMGSFANSTFHHYYDSTAEVYRNAKGVSLIKLLKNQIVVKEEEF